MRKIEYTTARGNRVEYGIRTETPNFADSNISNKCWEIEVRVNGERQMMGGSVTNHPAHGVVIECGNLLIPVPADKAAEVTAIYNEYRAELDRRLNSSLEADRKYEQGRSEVLRRLNQ